MADETKKYLDSNGLIMYDQKIKEAIEDIDDKKMNKFEKLTWGQLCGKASEE